MNKRIVMLLSNAYNPDDRVRNEALALFHSGFDVTIIAWDRFLEKPKDEIIEGIHIHRIHARSGYGQAFKKYLDFLWVWARFFFEAIRIRPAVIHCHDFDTYLVGLVYAFFSPRSKLVFDAHENYSLMMETLVPQKTTRFIRKLEKSTVRFADLLIAACAATAQHYRSMGVDNAVIVGNWKDPNLFNFPQEQIEEKRQALGAQDKVFVTYIGSLTRDRNVLPLLLAVKDRSWAFAIIGGTGGQEQEIRDFASSSSNIYFPGYIHPDQVPFYTAISDVIYYGMDPSDLYAPYNAPNKLFEALAAGKTILASDLGGELSAVVRSTGCGMLLPAVNAKSIGEALDKLADPVTRNAMAANARLAGETTYNWKIASQRLINAYHQVCPEISMNDTSL